jgi:mannitol 2-dehydrogenase
VVDRLKAGGGVDGLALVSALWCRYCHGETESGKTIAPNDPNWPRLQAAAKAARSNPRAFLEMDDIFGQAGRNPLYVAAFSGALSKLWAEGVRATLADYLARRP